MAKQSTPSEPEISDVLHTLATQDWISLRKFAVLIGISYPTAHKWCKEGKIETLRIGKIHRVYNHEIQRFLNAGLPVAKGGGQTKPSSTFPLYGGDKE